MWVPGCATGEEAYSLAIAVNEFLESSNNAPFPIQIFVTDVSERALEKARGGSYTSPISATFLRPA
jgi:two-component system CheB/CheR fusion protein